MHTSVPGSAARSSRLRETDSVWRSQRHQPSTAVDIRAVLAARDAAFFKTLNDLEMEWRGAPEDQVRVGDAARGHRGIGVTTELELLTLQIVDEDGTAKDPDQMQRIFSRLDEAASASTDPFEG